jgi:gliding motility-associated-like protein
MTAYTWTVSSGGKITAGGTTTDNTVTITWNTAGTQTASVNYNNATGCTAVSPTVKTITVNSLPVPTITGLTAIPILSSTVYTTQAGMTGYIWTVSAGGTITSGAGTNTITVKWNTAGDQTVAVNYNNANSCTAVIPTVINVTVGSNPTIDGPTPVCVTSTNSVYTTEAGMINYVWTVSAGCTITAGAGTNAITVTWNTIGAQTVSVNYTNGSGITAASPTVYNVTVNSLPVPAIAGSTSVCVATTNIYTTEAGMTAYTWTVSSGGKITAGGTTTDNTVTIIWNTAGTQTVSVNYTNAIGCTAASPTVKTITVNSLPVPTITGLTAIPILSSTVYTTQAGMTGYIWTVSAGGTIIAGGTATDNTVTVTWNTAGAQTVAINYNNANSCTAVIPTVINVTVGNLPIPTITGPTPVCVTSTNNVYVTEAGMTAYTWTVSAGGTITAGGTATNNTVTVTWNTVGIKTVTVNYTNGAGSTGASPTPYTVTVNSLPIPGILGLSAFCMITSGNVFTTETGMTGYTWIVSAGGTITAGGTTTDNTVTIIWNIAGTQTVSVNYTNATGCTAAIPTVKTVTVNSTPSTPTYTLIQPNNTVTTGTITVTTPTGTGMTYSIDGLDYTNTTGVFTELPGNYSITAMNSTGCISIPTVVTIVAANADLSVVKTVNNVHPIIGQKVVFTIVATNNGPDIATEVTVNDIIESGYTYVSSTTTVGTYDPSTGIWTIGTMINGVSESLTITATVKTLGSYVNTSTITSTVVDGDTGNNTSTIITYPTDFFIPEGFSPNGDGTNDLFVIRGILNFPKNKFLIYNRWGNKVYEASPYINMWDGRSMFGLRVGSNELPIGTYFYVLDLMDGSDIFKGSIYLNR